MREHLHTGPAGVTRQNGTNRPHLTGNGSLLGTISFESGSTHGCSGFHQCAQVSSPPWRVLPHVNGRRAWRRDAGIISEPSR